MTTATSSRNSGSMVRTSTGRPTRTNYYVQKVNFVLTDKHQLAFSSTYRSQTKVQGGFPRFPEPWVGQVGSAYPPSGVQTGPNQLAKAAVHHPGLPRVVSLPRVSPGMFFFHPP